MEPVNVNFVDFSKLKSIKPLKEGFRAEKITKDFFSGVSDAQEKIREYIEAGKLGIMGEGGLQLKNREFTHFATTIRVEVEEGKDDIFVKVEELAGDIDEIVKKLFSETPQTKLDEDTDSEEVEVEDAAEKEEARETSHRTHDPVDTERMEEIQADSTKAAAKAEELTAAARARGEQAAEQDAQDEADAEKKAALKEFKEHKHELGEEERFGRREEDLNIDHDRSTDKNGKRVDLE